MMLMWAHQIVPDHDHNTHLMMVMRPPQTVPGHVHHANHCYHHHYYPSYYCIHCIWAAHQYPFLFATMQRWLFSFFLLIYFFLYTITDSNLPPTNVGQLVCRRSWLLNQSTYPSHLFQWRNHYSLNPLSIEAFFLLLFPLFFLQQGNSNNWTY